jgi:hypothetical protein
MHHCAERARPAYSQGLDEFGLFGLTAPREASITWVDLIAVLGLIGVLVALYGGVIDL